MSAENENSHNPTTDLDETRSSSLKKLVFISFGVALLTGIASLLILIFDPRLSPVEQKLLGRWSTTNATLGELYYEFYADRKFVMTEQASGMKVHFGRWRMKDSRFETTNSSGTLSDWYQDLTGKPFLESFQIKFHDNDRFELYLNTPNAHMMFERVSAP